MTSLEILTIENCTMMKFFGTPKFSSLITHRTNRAPVFDDTFQWLFCNDFKNGDFSICIADFCQALAIIIP